MTLSTKTLLAVLLVTVLSLSSAIAVQYLLVRPQMEALQGRLDQKDVERVLRAILRETENLSRDAYDNAVWDDTYEYFLDPSSDRFLHSAFAVETFVAQEWSLMALLDSAGQPFLYRESEPERNRFRRTPLVAPAELGDIMQPVPRTELDAPLLHQGMIMTSRGPLLYASAAVQRTNETGVPPGTLLIGRYLDERLVDKLRDSAQIEFELRSLDAAERSHFRTAKLERLSRDDNGRLHWYYADQQGMPLVGLNIRGEDYGWDDRLIPYPVLFSTVTLLSCFALLVLLIRRVIIKPLLDVVSHLGVIRKSSDFSLRVGTARRDEIGQLERECDTLIKHVEQQQQVLAEQSADLHRLSFEDPLTGLANRRRLDQLMHEHLAMAHREDRPLAILLCDVDYFKDYNDGYGHQRGDEALVHVADVLFNAINRETDYAGRFGGEEFMVLLPNTAKSGAQVVVERIMAGMRDRQIPHTRSRVSRYLTLSIGVAILEAGRMLPASELFDLADRALYDAKNAGRNRVVYAQATTGTTRQPGPPA